MPARSPKFAENPSIIDRLIAHFGNGKRMADAMGYPMNYPFRWQQKGFIPEEWALDMHRLEVMDEWGLITAMDVLYEAEAVKQERLRAAGVHVDPVGGADDVL